MTEKESENAPKCSPLPWTVTGRHPYLVADVCGVPIMLDTPDSGGGPFPSVGTQSEAEANAQLIVRATNSHAVAIKLMQAVLDAAEFDELVLIANEFQEMNHEES